jgi:tetratricopeptide (TPR) repeat protein
LLVAAVRKTEHAKGKKSADLIALLSRLVTVQASLKRPAAAVNLKKLIAVATAQPSESKETVAAGAELLRVAQVYCRINQVDVAERCYTVAFAVNPKLNFDGTVLHTFADCLVEHDMYEKAIALYEKALANIKPSDPFLASHQRLIKAYYEELLRKRSQRQQER